MPKFPGWIEGLRSEKPVPWFICIDQSLSTENREQYRRYTIAELGFGYGRISDFKARETESARDETSELKVLPKGGGPRLLG